MKNDGSRAQACYQYKALLIISLVHNESSFKMQSTVGSYVSVQVPFALARCQSELDLALKSFFVPYFYSILQCFRQRRKTPLKLCCCHLLAEEIISNAFIETRRTGMSTI